MSTLIMTWKLSSYLTMFNVSLPLGPIPRGVSIKFVDVVRKLDNGASLYVASVHSIFNIRIFWHIDAHVRVGRPSEAREIFEAMLGSRNALGLLCEDIDPASGGLSGSYPQTYSLVGIIDAATRLSESWEDNA